jgi:hypothetical protein
MATQQNSTQQNDLKSELNVSVDFEFGLTEDDDSKQVEFSVNNDYRIRLTIDEARLLAIKIIQAANQADVKRLLQGQTRYNLARN